MRESIVTGPLFNPDSEEEYLDPDDVEMKNDERGTPHAENDIAPVAEQVAPFRYISNNPLLKIGPFPQRASRIQGRRNNIEPDNNDGTSHPESLTPAWQQNTGAGAGTVVLFRRNPDCSLFKHGTKRPVEEDEQDRNRKDEERKNQVRINVRAIRVRNKLVC